MIIVESDIQVEHEESHYSVDIEYDVNWDRFGQISIEIASCRVYEAQQTEKLEDQWIRCHDPDPLIKSIADGHIDKEKLAEKAERRM